MVSDVINIINTVSYISDLAPAARQLLFSDSSQMSSIKYNSTKDYSTLLVYAPKTRSSDTLSSHPIVGKPNLTIAWNFESLPPHTVKSMGPLRLLRDPLGVAAVRSVLYEMQHRASAR